MPTRASHDSIRTLGEAALIVLCSIVILTGLVVLHLQLPPGRRLVRSLVEQLANDSLAGELRVGSVESVLPWRLEARDVRLLDEQQRTVLEVRRGRGRVRLLSLLGSRLHFSDLLLDHPTVRLLESPDGSPSIVSALEPEAPAAPGAPAAPFVGVVLEEVRIRRGRVTGRANGVEIEVPALDAQARLETGAWVRLDLAWASILVHEPVGPRAGARVRLAGSWTIPDDLDARARIEWQGGQARVALRFTPPRVDVRLSTTAASAEGVRVLWRDYPLEGPVELNAAGAGTLDRLWIDLRAAFGTARVAIHGELHPAEPSYEMLIAASQVDLARLAPQLGVQAAAGLEGRLFGRGLELSTLDARFRGALAQSSIEGVPVPAGELEAHFGPRGLEVVRYAPRGAGLRGEVHGSLAWNGSFRAHAELHATDLTKLELFGLARGRASLRARVEGSPDRPVHVLAAVALSRFAIGPLRTPAGELTVDAMVTAHLPRADGLRLDVLGDLRDATVSDFPLGQVKLLATTRSGVVRGLIDARKRGQRARISLVLKPVREEGGVDITLPSIEIGQEQRLFRGRADRIVIRPERVTVDGLVLARADGTRIEAGGWVAKAAEEQPSELDVLVNATGVDVQEVLKLAGIAGEVVGGRADLRLLARGELDEPTFELSAAVERGRYDLFSDLNVAVAATYADERLVLDVDALRRGTPMVSASGSIPFDLYATGRRRLAEGDRDLELNVHRVAAEEAIALLGVSMPAPVFGDLSGALRLTGTWQSPSGELQAVLRRARWGEIDDIDATVVAGFARKGLDVDITFARHGRRVVTARGSWAVPVEKSIDSPLPTPEEILNAPAELELAFGPLDETVFPVSEGRAQEWSMQVRGAGRFTGSVVDPALEVRLDLWGLSHPRIPLRSSTTGFVVASLREQNLQLSSAGIDVAGRPLLRLAGGMRLKTEPTMRLGRFALQADIPDFDLGQLTSLEGEPVQGALSARALLWGEPTRPRGMLRSETQSLVLSDRVYDLADVEASYDGQEVRARAQLRQDVGGTFAARATLPLKWDPFADRFVLGGVSDVRGTVQAAGFALDGLGFLFSGVDVLSGQIDARLSLTGRPGRPRLAGTAQWRRGAFELAAVGQRFTDVTLRAWSDGERLGLSELTVHDRGGRLRATGQATMDGLEPRRIGLRLRAREFPVVYDGVTVAGVSGRIETRGELKDQHLHAKATTRLMSISLPSRPPREVQSLDPHPDIRIIRHGEVEAQESVQAAAAAAPFSVEIVIRMPTNVWVTRDDLSVALDGELRVRIEPKTGLILLGTIHLQRGFVTAYGKRFDIDRGDIVFTGGTEINPRLDVEAIYNAPDTPVHLRIGGTAERPVVDVSAEGLSQSQVLSMLLTGRTEVGASGGGRQPIGTTVRNEAAELLASLGFDVARDLLAQVLPPWLPRVTVVPSEGGVGAGALHAGRQLTDKLYVEATLALGADQDENTYELRTHYRLSRRWSLDSFYGDAGTGGLDVLWTYRY